MEAAMLQIQITSSQTITWYGERNGQGEIVPADAGISNTGDLPQDSKCLSPPLY